MSVSHEDLNDRLQKGEDRFTAIELLLKEISHGQEEFRHLLRPVTDDIAEIKEVIGAWKAVAALGRFIKWIGGVAAGGAAIGAAFWAFAKAAAFTVIR